MAMVFVVVQLMDRPRPLQLSAIVSSMALRSSHESDTKAMSSVYSRSVMIVSSCSLFLLHELGIMEVGHACLRLYPASDGLPGPYEWPHQSGG